MKLPFSLFLGVSIIASIGVASAAAPIALTLEMKSLNGSHEDGTATLTQLDDGVKVVIALKNGTPDAQPTRIHLGPCGNDTALEHPLASTVDGKATSIVHGITIAQLLKTPHSINVHKSTSDLATYVSCATVIAPS